MGANQRLNTNIKLILTGLSRSLYLEPFNKIRVFVFVFINRLSFKGAFIDMGSLKLPFSFSDSLFYNCLDFQNQVEGEKPLSMYTKVWFGLENLLVKLTLSQWPCVQPMALKPSLKSLTVLF